MATRADGGVRTGVVFVVNGERVLFCFDDRVWESMTIAHVREHSVPIADLEKLEDFNAERISVVLMSRNNPRL
eukprot:5060442-Pleurochrysis_carterae.AAC.1